MAKRYRAGTDDWWQQKIDEGVIKGRPGLLKCIFCGNTMKTKSQSICNYCMKARL